MSYSSLIKDEIEDSLDEDLRSNFNAIDDAGKRIIRTTDLILNMSEIQTGNYEYDAVEFNIFDEVLVSIYNEFKDMANTLSIEFTLNQLSESASIMADKYSVYQIFTNLIDNAFKYTPSGRIEVNYFRDKKNLPTVEVIDTGIGIAKQYIPNLFKPFTQEEQGYNRRFEGNGLGLALVKSYCDMNNATIKVKTVKNFGSTFTVKFNKQSK
jgi:signal transduction histidine kinase